MNPVRVAAALLLIACVALAADAQGRRQAAPAGLERHSWTIGGVERTALIAGPKPGERKQGTAPPIVLVFHGHGGTSAQAARSFRIHEAWPEAVVVYPQGLPTVGQVTDPQGRLPGWQHMPGGENDRDLKFVDAMFAWLDETYGLDPARTFAAGHSNGGSMVYTLWAARGDRFAAVASSASVLRPDLSVAAKPKPAFIVAGREDALVPFASQQRSLQSVLRLNQASATSKPWSGGAVEYESRAGAGVISYIHAGGHAMPEDTGALMVKFFKGILRIAAF